MSDAKSRALEFWKQGGYDMGAVESIEVHINMIDKLRADLSESRRLLDEARAQSEADPVAYMHNKRADVIHASVKSLLSDFAVNSGPESMLRPIDKSENYTIPLYAAAPVPAQPALGLDVIAGIESADYVSPRLRAELGMPSHVAELATNIRRNLKHMAQTVNDRDTPHGGELLDYINHMDTIAQQIETDAGQPAAVPEAVAKDARCGLVIHTPLSVFSDGPWIFSETGQSFTGDELDVEAFCRYRNALLAAPVPYGFGHLPQVATEDMQDNMRTALIDQGWTSDSAGEVDFQDIWDAAVVQFVESAEDAYAAILSAADTEVKNG